MSGHSKWSSIKHQKGVADARRGQVFTKLTREIMIAVREGGDNPDSNFRLRLIIQKARDASMPMDNVDRAIKRAAGKLEGAAALVEITYEGYGPGGVAVLVQAVTDNRNRTLQEVRNVFSRGGGAMGDTGSVAWQFNLKGVITIDAGDGDAEEIALTAIDAGAEDFNVVGSCVEVNTDPKKIEAVRKSLEEQGMNIISAEISQVPENTVELDEKKARQTLRLLEKLESMDDIQQVYSNMDVSDEVMAQLKSEE
ncbi:MAG: YebC/PmpR family DNA-binding transcriptional regulator [Dehalococcoidia bacterium]|nr:YebC/PmpR family DNA-binding transcriptional regulator [Dehalococcoidia bacterium]